MPEKLAPNVLSWATDLDDKTIAQARRSAGLPFIVGHVALMPDAHFGYGATVGSVIPTDGAIIPSAVGVDIGCGMIARKLSIDATSLPDDLGALHSMIAAAVPAGVGRGHDRTSIVDGIESLLPYMGGCSPALIDNDQRVRKAISQFGSLGSGNHFVEVCLDETDRV